MSRVGDRSGTKSKVIPGANTSSGGAAQKYRGMTGRPYGRAKKRLRLKRV